MEARTFRSLFGLVLGASTALTSSACKPRFEPSGSLSVDGRPFAPTECHVLTGATGGIELGDSSGNRLELALPPGQLQAWQEVGGTPAARFFPAAGPAPVALGPCGSLTLTGEGYHGAGKRAASGRLTASCSGKLTVRGSLTFSGCF